MIAVLDLFRLLVAYADTAGSTSIGVLSLVAKLIGRTSIDLDKPKKWLKYHSKYVCVEGCAPEDLKNNKESKSFFNDKANSDRAFP